MHKERSNQFFHLDILLFILLIYLQKKFFSLSELGLACGLNQCWAALGADTHPRAFLWYLLETSALQPCDKESKECLVRRSVQIQALCHDSVTAGWTSHPLLGSLWHCLTLTKRGFSNHSPCAAQGRVALHGWVATHPWSISCVHLAVPAVIPGLKGNFLSCGIKVCGHLFQNRSKSCHQGANILIKAL